MSRDSIKMLAMLTMLLNHIANALLPAGAPLTNLFLCIGYFTAVTMCYFLVEGYGYTHSKRRYAGRLLGFAVLAQLPYQLAFPENGMAGFVQFNMLFTLLLCFLILLVQEKVSDPILRGAAIVLLICWPRCLRCSFRGPGLPARAKSSPLSLPPCCTAVWRGWAAGCWRMPSAAVCRFLSPASLSCTCTTASAPGTDVPFINGSSMRSIPRTC